MSLLDALTKSLVDIYASKLSTKEQQELIECLDVLANDAKYNKFKNIFPEEGELRRELYRKHWQFFNAGSKYRERFFLACNRGGKSEAGAFEITCHATGIYRDYWEGHRCTAPPLIWIGGDTAATCRDIIQKKLLGDFGDLGSGMIPKDLIIDTKPRRGTPDAVEMVRVKHITGGTSTIVFKTYDQGREVWQGDQVDVIWGDEEMPMAIYGEAMIRLMTTNGIMMTTFTPLSGLTDLVVNALDNSQETDAEFPKHITTLSWDEVPHISEEMKRQMLEATPPALREARSKGIPTVGSGLIYPIDQKNIVVDDFKVPHFWPKLYGFDVGWNNTAAPFGAWDRDNDVIYIYSEYKRGGQEGEDMPLVHSSAIQSRGKWIKGVIDPAARGRSQVDGENLYRIYRKHGLKISPADNSVEAGIYAVWERLNSGRLKVFKSCPMLLRELSLYHRDEKGKIVKTNDHLCLSGDTKVLTEDGYLAIKDTLNSAKHLVSYTGNWIKPTEFIKTKESADVLSVCFENDIEIKMTPDHLLLSVDGFWYPACISQGISSFKVSEDLCKLRLNQKNNKNFLEKLTGSVDFIFKDTESDFTEEFGSTTTEKYLKLTKSIIEMEIDRTTKSATSNVLMNQNMLHYIQNDLLPKGVSALLATFKEYKKQRKFGMVRMLEEIGIENIMKSLNTFFTLEWNENVPFAENYTKLVNVLNKMLSVPITVSLLGDEKLALTMLQGFVKFVETNLLLTNITRQQHVIELVQQGFGKKTKVKFLKEVPNEDVYCCSVDYLDSFVVEGGLVVHNCDALRYLCMAPAHLWSLPEREQPKSNVVPMSNYAQGWS